MALVRLASGHIVHTSIFDPPRLQPKPWGNTLERYFMQDVMIDLETLGTVPGCIILSIGAVYFEPRTGTLGDEFHTVIRHADSVLCGLREDPRTRAWWEEQSPAARKVLDAVNAPDAPELKVALNGFNQFLRPGVRVWGNGADFDNPILACAYNAAQVPPGWKPYNGRCYRTIKNLAPHIKLVRQGTHHNALADAKSQAAHLCDIVRNTTITLG